MKIILSRKGFDSSYGGVASPILPDGTLLSLPIPEAHAPMTYGDLTWNGQSLGPLVEDLTRGRLTQADQAHLDPDLSRQTFPRLPGWRPLFGQASTAQSHLKNQGVDMGDLFLFFGWFHQTELIEGHYRYLRSAPDLHVIYGWLQIGQVLHVGRDHAPAWAVYHPHFDDVASPNNTVYVARETLQLQAGPVGVPGAGVFPKYDPALCLTALPARERSLWRLPAWIYPPPGRPPLTYHRQMSRWELQDEHVLLQSAARGQEFVLDADLYPQALSWVRDLFLVTQPRA